MASFTKIKEAQLPRDGGWTLCLQWGRYDYDDGAKAQEGYRFIWRRPDGILQPARGQARIPSLADVHRLMAIAIDEGWGNNRGEESGHATNVPADAGASTDPAGDEILDEWHAAKIAHAIAADDEIDEAFQACVAGEGKALAHFGLGKHMKAYKARYPEEK